jgi:hypothetical protein
MPRPNKSRRPAAPKPKLPEQLRRDAALRPSAKPGFNRPAAARKAPPTRRSGGHRG